ncbi:MAG TPA: DUF2267 domain-containing protein [Pirellulales bacterium]|nr:DUF2267 domain-containing protein [Pirellulales bacterium]
MSHTNAAFDATVQATNAWVADLAARLGWSDHHHAYMALRAVLHALRDRLSVEHVADLSAQLPMLVRGFYYEGWHPAGKPLKDRKEDDFLEHVADNLRGAPDADPRQVTRAVFALLRQHVSHGEIESLRATLPHELKLLWK